MKAVIVAHGDVDASDRDLLSGADLVIAADGGGFALERWGILPQLAVGDFDSYGIERANALGKKGVKVVAHPAAKAESDLELALRSAIEQKASEIVVLGAFRGERLDHELANIMLLADPAYRGRTITAIQGNTRVRALHGGSEHIIDAAVGSDVTLLPVGGDATGVRTTGLRYALHGETLEFGRSRGLSNVVALTPASVSLEHGVLLVIETRKGGTP
ncbi:MAG TPA: thiamine diphosphokinase [Candidatus Limnocylindria bacterium]